MNDIRRILVVSPSAPPAICGVSDFSFRLADQLKRDRVVDLGVSKLPSKLRIDSNHFSSLTQAISTAIHSDIGTDALLNFTPRSYNRIGLPLSLLNNLRILRRYRKDSRLFVIFHETWGDGGSIHHQIISQLSKLTARQLIKQASSISAVTADQSARLDALCASGKTELFPISSNITPPQSSEIVKLPRDNGVWVIFGLPHSRRDALVKLRPFLISLISLGVLSKIWTIGPSEISKDVVLEREIAEYTGITDLVEPLGHLSNEEISKRLCRAKFAFTGQTGDSILKSGTFMAYAAHGLTVIGTDLNSSEPGKYLIHPNTMISCPELKREKLIHEKAEALHHWFWSNRSWPHIGNYALEWMS